jgi:uncharacterized protein with GYD domain
MAVFVILSTLTPEAHAHPNGFRVLAKEVSERIKAECPGVKWRASFATMGRFDAVDVVECEDAMEVSRAAAIIRTVGRAQTETLPAVAWKDYLEAV